MKNKKGRSVESTIWITVSIPAAVVGLFVSRFMTLAVLFALYALYTKKVK